MTEFGIEGTESKVVSIAVDRPEPGETLTVTATPGLHVVLAFEFEGADDGRGAAELV